MAMFREIVTRAVIGKGRKSLQTTYDFVPDNSVSKVLGCWIINSKFSPTYNNNVVEIVGSYDVHVWYGYDNDTKTELLKRTVEYKEVVALKLKQGELLSDKTELQAFSTKYPTCSSLKLLPGGHIELFVETEFIIDAVGETKLKVQISSLDDLANEEWLLEEEIESNIDVDYILKNKV